MESVLLAAMVVAAAAVTPIQAAAQVASSGSPRRDISGTWHYNPQASDNPAAVIPRETGGPGTQGGFGRGGRQAAGGGGMSGRPALTPAARERLEQTTQLATQAPDLLRIIPTDSAVSLVEVTTADTLRLRTNGKKLKQQLAGGGEVEIRAEWKEDGLIVERIVNGGGRITETYFRTSDGKQLMVIVKVETNRFPKGIQFRRVYDAVTGGA